MTWSDRFLFLLISNMTCVTLVQEIRKEQPRLWHILTQFSISVFGEYGVVLNNKGYKIIELFILLQLIQDLTPGSNLINFYEDQKEVGVRKCISHK